jgi:hypothetical protein
MAVAAPARRSAPSPAPSRTAPPRKKAAAPARQAPRRRATAAATAPAPARRAPARVPRSRPSPARRTAPKPKRAGGQPSLALVVGRTAVAVGQLPDSGLVVRMTRGRAWIGVLGLLLAGIVALNVVTLSFAASSGKIDAAISSLDRENRILGGREANKFSTDRIRHEGAAAGLSIPTSEEPLVIEISRGDAATAAARLAAAGAG